ncbi:CWF19-like protein 1 isoform X2 [Lycorma delicatula]|uniref:CWF19-like protein 1 isoform X2 n=1 Tax=Lycorma delicatula TaxID=130591 RepID=UPI003F517DAF
MSNKDRVLVCGDVNGKFKTLFARVENINKKNGPFSYVLCVGNFFGSSDSIGKEWEPYSSGRKNVPVPMYVLGGNNEKHIKYFTETDDSGQIAPNVTYLGKRGVIKTVTGLRIAYVSGVEQNGCSSDNIRFSMGDVTHVRDMCVGGQPSYIGVDFLLTSSWPKDITRLDPKPIDNAPPGSPLLSWLSVQLKPRYHVCGLEGLYYERPPYRNLDTRGDNSVHCSRFIALAPVGNKENKKWLLALSVSPIDKMKTTELYQPTTDQTAIPYCGSALSARCNDSDEPTAQYFYDMSSTSPHTGTKRRHDGSYKKSREKPVFDQDKCWFCLASPEVEKHLVISVGTEVYLALAKGGLVNDHLLILTVGHYQSTSCLPENISDEIEQFKTVLRKYYSSKNKVPIFFERNYKTSHLQIQVVPVPNDKTNGLVIKFQGSSCQ